MNLLFYFSLLIWGIESFSTAYITICAVVFSLYFITLTVFGGVKVALISLVFDLIPMGIFIWLGCPIVPVVIVTFVMHLIALFVFYKLVMDDVLYSSGLFEELLGGLELLGLIPRAVVVVLDLLGMILTLVYVL